MSVSAWRLWWRYFNAVTQGRWVVTFILTSFACGLLWLIGPAWLFVLGVGVDTTGYVLREGEGVRYDDHRGQRHTVSKRLQLTDHQRSYFWGDSVKVQYLRFAPGISWCPKWEEPERLGVLMIAFVAFVATPLGWLWWKNGIRPGRAAWRHVQIVRRGRAALGVVVDPQSSVAADEPPDVLLYTFPDHTGRQWTGTVTVPLPESDSGWQPGSPLLVLFDPGEPARHEPDLFEARSDDLAALLRAAGINSRRPRLMHPGARAPID